LALPLTPFFAFITPFPLVAGAAVVVAEGDMSSCLCVLCSVR
jgi:hypothetical protein